MTAKKREEASIRSMAFVLDENKDVFCNIVSGCVYEDVRSALELR
jgi:predicted DNA-binding protein with PD1-like motif